MRWCALCMLLCVVSRSPAQTRFIERYQTVDPQSVEQLPEPDKASGVDGAEEGRDKKDNAYEEENEIETEREEEEAGDLTLRNLFHAGWNERFQGRSRAGRAPRFHFFSTRQPFLDREIRVNYDFVNNVEGTLEDEHSVDMEIEIPFNRRFMLDVEPAYTWVDAKDEEDNFSGAGLTILTFLQLIDTYDTAANFQFAVTVPSVALDTELATLGDPEAEIRQTRFSFIFAGFQDLTRFGLYRTSASGHIEYTTLVGPGEDSAPEDVLTYGLTFAKTFVEPDARFFADFTLFVETFGATTLTGETASRTGITFTPGLRWNLWKEDSPWFLMAGVEIPVTGPQPFDQTILVSLVHWFDFRVVE